MGVPNVVKGTIALVSTADGGRTGRIFSGYRGALFFDERDEDGLEIHYDAITLLDGTDEVAPGESSEVTIHLVSPERFPPERLAPGQTFDVKEGHRVVGRVTVQALERDPRPFRERNLGLRPPPDFGK